jgi:hypothetical protein
MAAAGEQFGRAVGTGVRTAREAATEAGKIGLVVSRSAATRAQQELLDRGIDTDELRDRIVSQTTGLGGENLTRRSQQAREYLAKNTDNARRELAARIDPGPRRSRRKWPWIVLASSVAAGAAVVAVVLSRRPEEIPVAEAEPTYPDDIERPATPPSDSDRS